MAAARALLASQTKGIKRSLEIGHLVIQGTKEITKTNQK